MVAAMWVNIVNATSKRNSLHGQYHVQYNKRKHITLPIEFKIIRQTFFNRKLDFLFPEDMTKTKIKQITYSIGNLFNWIETKCKSSVYNAFNITKRVTHCIKRLFKTKDNRWSCRYAQMIQWNVELFLTTDENDIIVDMVA